ncbi:MAG: hypothetical protein IJZ74_09495 [Clostridia bacterium]|nr:hypothetical protein [Clostridia bacterium]
MNDIKPRTYREVVCLCNCMGLHPHVQDIPNETLVKMYHFLLADPANQVRIIPGRIVYYSGNETTDEDQPDGMRLANTLTSVSLTASLAQYNYPVQPSSRSSSSYDRFSGGSSNNNNNNNNHNTNNNNNNA